MHEDASSFLPTSSYARCTYHLHIVAGPLCYHLRKDLWQYVEQHVITTNFTLNLVLCSISGPLDLVVITKLLGLYNCNTVGGREKSRLHEMFEIPRPKSEICHRRLF